MKTTTSNLCSHDMKSPGGKKLMKPSRSKFQFTRSSTIAAKEHDIEQFKQIIEKKKGYQSMIKQQLLKLERMNMDEDPQIQPFNPAYCHITNQTQIDADNNREDNSKIMQIKSLRMIKNAKMFMKRLRDLTDSNKNKKAASYFYYTSTIQKYFQYWRKNTDTFEIQDSHNPSFNNIDTSNHQKCVQLSKIIKISQLKSLISAAYCLKLQKRTKVFQKVLDFKRKKTFINRWSKKYTQKNSIIKNFYITKQSADEIQKKSFIQILKQKYEVKKKEQLTKNVRMHRYLLKFIENLSFLSKQSIINQIIGEKIFSNQSGSTQLQSRELMKNIMKDYYYVQKKKMASENQQYKLMDEMYGIDTDIPVLFEEEEERKKVSMRVTYLLKQIKLEGWIWQKRVKQGISNLRFNKNNIKMEKVVIGANITKREQQNEKEKKRTISLIQRKEIVNFFSLLRGINSIQRKIKSVLFKKYMRRFVENSQSDLKLEKGLEKCLKASRQWLARTQLNEGNKQEVINARGEELIMHKSKFKKTWLRYVGKIWVQNLLEYKNQNKRMKFLKEILQIMVNRGKLHKYIIQWRNNYKIQKAEEKEQSEQKKKQNIEDHSKSNNENKDLEYVNIQGNKDHPHIEKDDIQLVQTNKQEIKNEDLKKEIKNEDLEEEILQKSDNIEMADVIKSENDKQEQKNSFNSENNESEVREDPSYSEQFQGDISINNQSQLSHHSGHEIAQNQVQLSRSQKQVQKCLFQSSSHQSPSQSKQFSDSSSILQQQQGQPQKLSQQSQQLMNYLQAKIYTAFFNQLIYTHQISQLQQVLLVQKKKIFVNNLFQKNRIKQQQRQKLDKLLNIVYKKQSAIFVNMLKTHRNINNGSTAVTKLHIRKYIKTWRFSQEWKKAQIQKISTVKKWRKDKMGKEIIDNLLEMLKNKNEKQINDRNSRQQQGIITNEQYQIPRQQIANMEDNFDERDEEKVSQKDDNSDEHMEIDQQQNNDEINKKLYQYLDMSPQSPSFKQDMQEQQKSSFLNQSRSQQQQIQSKNQRYLQEYKHKYDSQQQSQPQKEQSQYSQPSNSVSDPQQSQNSLKYAQYHQQKPINAQIQGSESEQNSQQNHSNIFSNQYITNRYQQKIIHKVFTILKEHRNSSNQKKRNTVGLKKTIFQAIKMHWEHKKRVRMFLKQYDQQISYYPSSTQQYQQFKTITAMCP